MSWAGWGFGASTFGEGEPMFANLLKPKTDLAALMLRMGLAAIFIVHGSMKIAQSASLLPDVMSLQMQNVLGWTELISGVALAVGLFSRLAALVIIPLQLGAIVRVTWRRALAGPAFEAQGVDFMKVGPEFNIVLIAMCLGVILLGSGVVSLDHVLLTTWRRKKLQESPQQTVAAVS
jgi:uncharacterized membrane protein YphA (DoxX/SURF4 family)